MFNTIHEAIADIKNGKMVIVVDSEDRENEGDLVMSGELVRAQDINFMIKEARGLVCTPVGPSIAKKLDFQPMLQNCSKYGADTCNFAITVDARADNDTGISPEDRMITTQKIVDKKSKPEDFIRPGHTFPLLAKEGGVLERLGHTEASIDLVKLAGLAEVATICEIINDDGTMARVPDLELFSKKHGIKMITIDCLVEFRKAN